MTYDEALEHIRSHIRQVGSRNKFCNEHGINRGHLSQVLSGKRKINAQIANICGLRMFTAFERVK